MQSHGDTSLGCLVASPLAMAVLFGFQREHASMTGSLHRISDALGRGPAGDAYVLRPLSAFSGEAARSAVVDGTARQLAGGERGFALVEIIARDPGAESGMVGAVASLDEARRWAAAGGTAAHFETMLGAVSASRAKWAGFGFERPLLMGIVNVTPDSFSDGGDHADAATAIAHGMALLEQGADILDVGGESTRPGAAPVTPAEEIRRIEPVVRALAAAGAVVSIDTRNAATMAVALAAGARIINDVTALAGDRDSLAIAARSGAPVVLMHMLGEPQTMQREPHYRCAPLDVLEYLQGRIDACVAAGIPRQRIVVDPGIGFGKRLPHNLQILARLSLLHLTGSAILLGVSRKSFIPSATAKIAPAKARLPGSLAAALAGLDQGVQILRVHDIAETRQAIQVREGIERSE
jgi:dihydropteroate synthase